MYLKIFFGLLFVLSNKNALSENTTEKKDKDISWEITTGFSRLILDSQLKKYFQNANSFQTHLTTPYLWKVFSLKLRPFISFSRSKIDKKTESINNEAHLMKFGTGHLVDLYKIKENWYVSSFYALNYYTWNASSHQKSYARRRIIKSNMLGIEFGLGLSYQFNKNFNILLQVSQNLPSFSSENGYKNASINLGWMI